MKQLHICNDTLIAWKLGRIRKRKAHSTFDTDKLLKPRPKGEL
jgi:hypothetical protein